MKGFDGGRLCRGWFGPLVIFVCLVFPALHASGKDPAPAKVNLTVPRVEPPKTRPEFSEKPTAQEISHGRFFEEPLVPIGGEPSLEENAALATALLGYATRSGVDDFGSLTAFLENHPKSPWQAALLTDLGLEYYNTAHYSRALEAWETAWRLAKDANDRKGKAIADRAAGELAYMQARLGMMTELDALLKSVEGRVFLGQATERISGAREALWNMQNRPEISFRCGPMALRQIKIAFDPTGPGHEEIANSASTQRGLSLDQVAELSRKVGLNYQMAIRENGGAFMVPSVVHWKVGHYAALVRRDGDRYLLQDPTFGNSVWATEAALKAEMSGYFLIPQGPLPEGWRKVESAEARSIWGKGVPGGKDPKGTCPGEPKTGGGPCSGMAVSGVHLMLVSLNLNDEPVGYSPPVGPAVRFTVRYNQRDAFQPANFTYSNFGPKWTCDWISYITDNPQSASADVNYYVMGGGTRTFTGFNPTTQSYTYQQYDQTLLTRTAPGVYQMLGRDGSKLIFSQSDGSIGTSRKIFLTQVVDPFGNAVRLSYDASLRLTTITDAINQVTTLTYGHTNDLSKITRVTDPFGRFAVFDYDVNNRLSKITDVVGLTSQFAYEGNSDFVNALITPYGTNNFIGGELNTTRWLETRYPDGSRDRVEFNQNTNGIAFSDPSSKLPQGMAVNNQWLHGRNTFYWSRNACATGYGDYSKAKIYHWLHTADGASAAGILESTKEALEGRVWYNYAGQPVPQTEGNSNLPTHVGRMLDDGSTQLSRYSYDGFGHVTSAIDPVGRTFSYLYGTNGIDLLEVRQTRGLNNELLSRTTYNAQHLPLTQVDAAGQTSTFTYNGRGQVLTTTNPKNETTAYTYDTNGYLIMVDGPLPGTNDAVRATYDLVGRPRTRTDESGYTLTFDYDALDRLIKVTHPDGTFTEYTFNRLDPSGIKDRAGRQTLLEHDSMRQMIKRTDRLNRVSLFQWCSCGDLSSLTDPMGRTTTWHKDVQGRLTSKQYGDGSQVRYFYENATSRLRQVVDEKQQVSQFTYNRDNTLNSIAYANAAVPTPGVSFTYDPNYSRVISMTDGVGTTRYSYNPITISPAPGAGELAALDGPLSNDTITYVYDELGRSASTTIGQAVSMSSYDIAGRFVAETNVLGTFTNIYDGASFRRVTQKYPNGLVAELSYGGNTEDLALRRISYRIGVVPISEFSYGRDIARDRITSWSQQAGAEPAWVYSFGYDAADGLVSATVTNDGVLRNSFIYTYDASGNRLAEQADATTTVATYNALNQLSSSSSTRPTRTNQWDAKDRLIAVNTGNQRTEFTYDGISRLASIRQLTNGIQVSMRRFVWHGDEIAEERNEAGVVTKRFFVQGMKVEIGPAAGAYYYTTDHLGSIRELVDGTGAIRARYTYDPYGRRTRVLGDLEADFGFAGMFWCSEAGLALTHFRAYDPELGRWLSRDPLKNAEVKEGPNLYAYVDGNPVNLTDPLGLCCETETAEYIDAEINQKKCRSEYDRLTDAHTAITAAVAGGITEDQEEALRNLYRPEKRKYDKNCGSLSQQVQQVTRRKNRLEYCRELPCEPSTCATSDDTEKVEKLKGFIRGDFGRYVTNVKYAIHKVQTATPTCIGAGIYKICY